MSYYEKYLKYKNKYLALKSQIEQEGGDFIYDQPEHSYIAVKYKAVKNDHHLYLKMNKSKFDLIGTFNETEINKLIQYKVKQEAVFKRLQEVKHGDGIGKWWKSLLMSNKSAEIDIVITDIYNKCRRIIKKPGFFFSYSEITCPS